MLYLFFKGYGNSLKFNTLGFPFQYYGETVRRMQEKKYFSLNRLIMIRIKEKGKTEPNYRKKSNYHFGVIPWLKYVLLSSYLIIYFSCFHRPQSDKQEEIPAPSKVKSAPIYQLPDTVSLCGEPIPLHDRNIWEALDREFTIEVWDRAQVIMWLKRSGLYFPYFEEELKKMNMPDDLKYLAVIESALLANNRSFQSAVGLWQFMRTTARSIGLRVDSQIDERRCFKASTKAAFKYLKELYGQFGSWTLALAAYNAGETYLRREIQRQKNNSYYYIRLHRETERFVYRIAACKIIMSQSQRYGFQEPHTYRYKPFDHEEIKVKINRSIYLPDLAEKMDTPYKTLKDMNPKILGMYLPYGTYTIDVPATKGKEFATYINTFKKRRGSSSSRIYIVKKGDNLYRISMQTGLTIAALKRLNNLKSSNIQIGQRLIIKP